MIFISSRADRYLLQPILKRLPDTDKYLVVLGDRKETFEAAAQAFHRDIPIIHINGGEKTPFSKDDVYRDCITRMSVLHFPPTMEAAKRIYQIRPGTKSIPCGAIGAELATTLKPIARTELPFAFTDKTWLVTWHPQPKEDVGELIAALKENDGVVIWTYPNLDPGYTEVIHRVQAAGFEMYEDLTMPVYLSLMHYVTGVVGNSSSGIIEAPSCGAQTINVGNRQKGRPMANSILSVPCEKEAIRKALRTVQHIPKHDVYNPYYMAGTVNTIVEEIDRRYGK